MLEIVDTILFDTRIDTLSSAPMTNETPPPSREGLVFSLGRLLALVVFAVLMLIVLLLTAMLVVPPELLRNSPLAGLNLQMQDTVAIVCATFFVITLVLWAFDAIGFFPFRNPWMSKAIWGACIASIIATSVSFYKGGARPQQQDLEGVWLASARYKMLQDNVWAISTHTVVMTYDKLTGKYLGHSDVQNERWFFIKAIDLSSKRATVTMSYEWGTQKETQQPLWGSQTATFDVSIDDRQSRIKIGADGNATSIILQRHGPIDQ
jgi:hypothetical protein